MTQDQQPALPTPSPRTAALLRFGAVLTASGPVILTAFGIGRQTVGWFCAPPASAPYPGADYSYPPEGLYAFDGPYSLAGPCGWGSYAPDDLPGELLFRGVLLLPIIVAGLIMYPEMADPQRKAEAEAHLDAYIADHHLKELRKSVGRTPSEVATALGISQGRVPQIENGDLESMDIR